MPHKFTLSELEAYLDEALSVEEMAALEQALRQQPDVVRQLAAINARRDAGVHTLGEIWRRQRVSCPTREQLGSFLLGVLPTPQADYLEFHIEKTGCRYCRANLEDMRRQRQETSDAVATRRTRYFQSSAGYLRGKS
jgi:anti-sigma factor RsiW